MGTYQVEVSREVTDLLTMTVEIEAADAAAAEAAALAKAQDGEYDGMVPKDTEVSSGPWMARTKG
jgi:hypothetical protein